MTFEKIYNTKPDKHDIGSSGYSRLKHLYDTRDTKLTYVKLK